MAMKGYTELHSIKSSIPRGCISKGGKVAINEAGVIAFKLSRFKYARLLYNEQHNRLGIAFSEKPPSEDGLIIQTRERAGIWVAGKAALASVGLIPSITTFYPLRPYEESDFEFVIDLNKGRERKKKKE